jgi:hypothetical protein
VTNYIAFPDAPEGRPTDFVRKLKEIASLVFSIRVCYMGSLIRLLTNQDTKILYCKGLSGDMNERCKVVGPVAMMWNGITASPDGQTVYVCELLDRKIFGFNRTASGELNVYGSIIFLL